MKWIAISGSWRYYSKALERDVRNAVHKVLIAGDSIVTGGALGVDYFATAEVLRYKSSEPRIKIYLPTTLDIYLDHYKKRAFEGVITIRQADMLEKQLVEVRENIPSAIIENFNFTQVSKESYFARNNFIIDACDELLAFHVNYSQGTLDAIRKARNQKKKVQILKYTMPQEKIA